MLRCICSICILRIGSALLSSPLLFSCTIANFIITRTRARLPGWLNTLAYHRCTWYTCESPTAANRCFFPMSAATHTGTPRSLQQRSAILCALHRAHFLQRTTQCFRITRNRDAVNTQCPTCYPRNRANILHAHLPRQRSERSRCRNPLSPCTRLTKRAIRAQQTQYLHVCGNSDLPRECCEGIHAQNKTFAKVTAHLC